MNIFCYQALLVPMLVTLACNSSQDAPSVTSGTSTSTSPGASNPDMSVPDFVFTLIDATTGASRKVITNLSTIAASDMTGQITIQIVAPAKTKSITFTLDGAKDFRVDNSNPFTVSGGDAPPYTPLILHLGPHILSATAYEDINKTGAFIEAQTIVFTISGL